MVAEREVVMTLKAQDKGIGVPFRELAEEGRKANTMAKLVQNTIQDIARQSRSLDSMREAWKGLANEAGKYRQELEKIRTESNAAFLRGTGALGNGVSTPGGGSPFAGLAGLGIGLASARLGLQGAASVATGITTGDVSQTGRRSLNVASLGIGETLVSIQRAAEGVNRVTAEIAAVERRRANLLDVVRGNEGIVSIRAPFIERQRAALEGLAGAQAGVGGARIQAAGESSQFRLGGLQAQLSEAQARFGAARGTGYLGAGQTISGINAQIASEFAGQGLGNPATQRALLESRAAYERAQSFEGGLRGQVGRQQGLVNDLTMRADRAQQHRDQVRRYGGPDPFGLGGLRQADTELGGANAARLEANRKLVELQDRLLEATERTKTAAEGYQQVQRESLAAEKERLTTAHGIAREQARAFRDAAFGQKQQLQVGMEGFALSNPLEKNRVQAVARKLAAGQKLNRLDIGIAQGNSFLAQSPLFQDYAKTNAAEDRSTQELRGLLGYDQRIGETERLAKEAGAREIKLAADLKANISVDAPALAEQLAQQLVPLIQGLVQQIKAEGQRAVERGMRDGAANRP